MEGRNVGLGPSPQNGSVRQPERGLPGAGRPVTHRLNECPPTMGRDVAPSGAENHEAASLGEPE